MSYYLLSTFCEVDNRRLLRPVVGIPLAFMWAKHFTTLKHRGSNPTTAGHLIGGCPLQYWSIATSGGSVKFQILCPNCMWTLEMPWASEASDRASFTRLVLCTLKLLSPHTFQSFQIKILRILELLADAVTINTSHQRLSRGYTKTCGPIWFQVTVSPSQSNTYTISPGVQEITAGTYSTILIPHYSRLTHLVAAFCVTIGKPSVNNTSY